METSHPGRRFVAGLVDDAVGESALLIRNVHSRRTAAVEVDG